MSPEREENGDGANNMHYPSPGAETMDAGPFYHSGAREGAGDDQQQAHGEQSADQMTDQVKGQEHNEMNQGEPTTPQQQGSRPPNIEELQLAAQLGQGLTGTPMMPSTDPNMNVEDPGLRNIMPHPENDQNQQQTPSYMHETPTSESMMTHGLDVSVGAHLASHYNIGDHIPPRKRSKVSRACDECRRKKIKCDAQTDTGEAPCSSCARSNIRCLFSRVPQKRGPSKGYVSTIPQTAIKMDDLCLTSCFPGTSKNSPTESIASRISLTRRAASRTRTSAGCSGTVHATAIPGRTRVGNVHTRASLVRTWNLPCLRATHHGNRSRAR